MCGETSNPHNKLVDFCLDNTVSSTSGICLAWDTGEIRSIRKRENLADGNLLESASGTEGYSVVNVIFGDLFREATGTWSALDSPIDVYADLVIPLGEELVIEPGVEVRVQGEFELDVFGRLEAVGTAEDSIRFLAPDTLTWEGINFVDSDTNGQDSSRVSYCRTSDCDRIDGPLYLEHSSDLRLSHSVISGNLASRGGGIRCEYSNPLLHDLLIADNGVSNGGACYLNFSHPLLIRVRMQNNTATWGGGLYTNYADCTLEHCMIDGNDATYGGAMRLSGGEVTAVNLTVSENTQSEFLSAEIDLSDGAGLMLQNVIIWSTLADAIRARDSVSPCELTVSYSDVQGGEAGIEADGNAIVNWLAGNLDSDPLFVDPAGGDFLLQIGSPCIDAGDPASGPDEDGTNVEMGAYYYFQTFLGIDAVTDIPHDQGRQVQLVWSAAQMDYENYSPHHSYSAWRLDPLFGRGAGGRLITDPGQLLPVSPGEEVFWQRDDDYVWVFLAQIPALQYTQYGLAAPTLIDSSAVDPHYTTFKVVFHWLEGFSESDPDSGYSVDNLPPDRVTNLSSGLVPGACRLEWDEVTTGSYEGNSYPELNGVWYRVHASDVGYFEPDAGTLLETVEEPIYYYTPPPEETRKFFRIVASDQP